MTNRSETRPVSAGMIIRQREPVNFEFPFDRMNSYLTPTELFYIRSHFHAPEINLHTYRLRLDGAVKNPLALSYQELCEMPSETQTATLECAGNSRVFLVPQAEGAQWELGAVGNAEWTGVPLRLLLEKARVAEDAVDIVFEGADRGTPKEKPVPPSPISYARSLPLVKASQAEVLVAYKMNGSDLPRDHGYPIRLIVPGHYGMASVKWLTRIQAVREPFQGYWQTSDYAYWDYVDGVPVRRPLSEMTLKSQIARPQMYEVIPAGEAYLIAGATWCGESDVVEIEVTTNGGESWEQAEFLDPVQRYSWRRWQFRWQAPKEPKSLTLMARGKDANGCAQPDEHDPNYGSYVIQHPLPVEVFVR